MTAITMLVLLLAIQQIDTLSADQLILNALAKDAVDAPVVKNMGCVRTAVAKDLKNPKHRMPSDAHPELNITLQKLLMAGRYRYESLIGLNTGSTQYIHFFPRPVALQPNVATSEGIYEYGLNRVLNVLEGVMEIDAETGSIKGITASLTVGKKPDLHGIVQFYEVHVDYDQQKIGEVWTPETISITLRYRNHLDKKQLILDFSENFELYITTFACPTRPPAP